MLNGTPRVMRGVGKFEGGAALKSLMMEGELLLDTLRGVDDWTRIVLSILSAPADEGLLRLRGLRIGTAEDLLVLLLRFEERILELAGICK